MDICETYSNRKLFCGGWEFYKAAFGSEYSEDLPFKPVDVPHDWLIYDTNDLYETSTGWYRKTFSYSKKEGIRTFIRFDGVYMDSKVYVNGVLAGEWKYGYSAFMFDITELVKNGECYYSSCGSSLAKLKVVFGCGNFQKGLALRKP